MRSKTVLVIAVAFAFILGTMVAGAEDVFAKEKLTKLQKECKKEPKKETKIKPHCEILNILEELDLIDEMVPISLGSGFIKKLARECPSSDDKRIQVDGGAVVLLSDGTVKVSSFAGGFTTPDPLFGSLPAGVWYDIEVEEYSFSSEPEGCSSSTITNEEMLVACAVASNGDIYCVDGKVNDGVLSGTPWTFQGNTLP